MVHRQEKNAFLYGGRFFLLITATSLALLLLSVVKALRAAFSILPEHAFINPWHRVRNGNCA
jgi:hypothetical protein